MIGWVDRRHCCCGRYDDERWSVHSAAVPAMAVADGGNHAAAMLHTDDDATGHHPTCGVWWAGDDSHENYSSILVSKQESAEFLEQLPH